MIKLKSLLLEIYKQFSVKTILVVDIQPEYQKGSGSLYGNDSYYSDNMEKLQSYINKYESKLSEFEINLKDLKSKIKSNETSLKSHIKKK